MKKRSLFTIILLFALSLVLVACGGNSNDGGNNGGNDGGNNDGGETPDFLSFLTGGTSGTYYPLGGAIAKIITDETAIPTDALYYHGAGDKMIELRDTQGVIVFRQTELASDAVAGENAFEGEPVDTVLAVGSLYPETVQIVTTTKSGIESVEDLKG